MEAKLNLIIIGAGGHAVSCIDVIEKYENVKILGLIGQSDEIGEYCLNYPVIGSDKDIPALVGKYGSAFIAVGQIKTPDLRIAFFEHLQKLNIQMPVFVSPSSSISKHTSIGEGSIIMPGAIVNAGATIGKNCIINSKALVEHNVTIGDHCHIATGAILNGDVSVGGGSFVGSGAIVKQGLSLGSKVVVGMGEVLKRDLLDNVTYLRK